MLVACDVTLWHMSICTGVVVAVAFQQVDCAPDAQAGTESHDEGLQNTDCAVEECHNFSSLFCPPVSAELDG